MDQTWLTVVGQIDYVVLTDWIWTLLWNEKPSAFSEKHTLTSSCGCKVDNMLIITGVFFIPNSTQSPLWPFSQFQAALGRARLYYCSNDHFHFSHFIVASRGRGIKSKAYVVNEEFWSNPVEERAWTDKDVTGQGEGKKDWGRRSSLLHIFKCLQDLFLSPLLAMGTEQIVDRASSPIWAPKAVISWILFPRRVLESEEGLRATPPTPVPCTMLTWRNISGSRLAGQRRPRQRSLEESFPWAPHHQKHQINSESFIFSTKVWKWLRKHR